MAIVKNSKTSKSTGIWTSLAVVRILLGLTFLWAFFDKLMGLGYATPDAKSWLNGGSPTYGFLSHAAGLFADFFHTLAGIAVIDWLFMLGLLGIGVALVFGIVVKLAVCSGSLLLLMMWAASLPIKANPIIDDHIIYIVVLVVIGYGLPNQKLSMASWWQKRDFVKNRSWLW